MKDKTHIFFVIMLCFNIVACKNVKPANNSEIKVISLAPSITKMICDLGQMDKLIGVTDYCTYDATFDSKIKNGSIERVSGFNSFNYEMLLAAHSDYIFYLDSITMTDKQHLEQLFDGTQTSLVAMVHPASFAQIKEQLVFIASYLGVTAQANTLCKFIDDKLAEIKPLPKKYSCIAEIFFPPYTTVGTHTFIADIIRQAGASLAIPSETNWPVITLEDIITASPDVVITTYKPINIDKNLLLIDAYKQGRIFTPSNIDYFMQPSLHSVDVCLELNEFLKHL